MRRRSGVLIATLLLAAGCTVRPPPIKSSPTTVDPDGPPECTFSDGIDPAGNPACSDGCTWNVPLKRCVREETKPKAPQVPPNGV